MRPKYSSSREPSSSPFQSQKVGWARAVDDDEVALVFWRLVGGAVGAPPTQFAGDILQNERFVFLSTTLNHAH